MNIGDRIKMRREELDMSQSELARRVGYTSRSTITKIERDGNGISQDKIVAIAKALKTTPSYLMGWTDDGLFINENGEAQLVSTLEPIEEEIVEKVKLLRPDFQRMASSMLDSLLEMQENAEAIKQKG
jgi:transcriptional regulator with XRE-family HTH domain